MKIIKSGGNLERFGDDGFEVSRLPGKESFVEQAFESLQHSGFTRRRLLTVAGLGSAIGVGWLIGNQLDFFSQVGPQLKKAFDNFTKADTSDQEIFQQEADVRLSALDKVYSGLVGQSGSLQRASQLSAKTGLFGAVYTTAFSQREEGLFGYRETARLIEQIRNNRGEKVTTPDLLTAFALIPINTSKKYAGQLEGSALSAYKGLISLTTKLTSYYVNFDPARPYLNSSESAMLHSAIEDACIQANIPAGEVENSGELDLLRINAKELLDRLLVEAAGIKQYSNN